MRELYLRGIGPSPRLDAEFGRRLNVFTGDNGLGKTFLLDVVWWVLTGSWAGQAAWPGPSAEETSMVRAVACGDASADAAGEIIGEYDFETQRWSRRGLTSGAACLAMYAQVDGGFAVWDPYRNLSGQAVPTRVPMEVGSGQRRPRPFLFTPENLWNGLGDNGRVLCNGLIRDWVTWQREPGTPFFDSLTEVLDVLSTPDEPIRAGKPTRVWLDDVRDIPTIRMPYGEVPVTLASAGMKRILGLAYLIVWTLWEHEIAADLSRREPLDSLVVLIDEVEAHLHPAWQRMLLPALLAAGRSVMPNISVQLMATTHSPMVLSSIEPLFDEASDKLFLFDLDKGAARLRELPWAKQGDAVGWLTSEVFGLRQARSREAERAIEAAEAYMRGEVGQLPEGLRTEEQIHAELLRVLPGHDPFWPRWIVEVRARL